MITDRGLIIEELIWSLLMISPDICTHKNTYNIQISNVDYWIIGSIIRLKLKKTVFLFGNKHCVTFFHGQKMEQWNTKPPHVAFFDPHWNCLSMSQESTTVDCFVQVNGVYFNFAANKLPAIKRRKKRNLFGSFVSCVISARMYLAP